MSYAIRNDGLGWRAVEGPDDCLPDETWQESQPAPVEVVPEPVVDPLAKFRQFLDANPDVAQMLGMK